MRSLLKLFGLLVLILSVTLPMIALAEEVETPPAFKHAPIKEAGKVVNNMKPGTRAVFWGGGPGPQGEVAGNDNPIIDGASGKPTPSRDPYGIDIPQNETLGYLAYLAGKDAGWTGFERPEWTTTIERRAMLAYVAYKDKKFLGEMAEILAAYNGDPNQNGAFRALLKSPKRDDFVKVLSNTTLQKALDALKRYEKTGKYSVEGEGEAGPDFAAGFGNVLGYLEGPAPGTTINVDNSHLAEMVKGLNDLAERVGNNINPWLLLLSFLAALIVMIIFDRVRSKSLDYYLGQIAELKDKAYKDATEKRELKEATEKLIAVCEKQKAALNDTKSALTEQTELSGLTSNTLLSLLTFFKENQAELSGVGNKLSEFKSDIEKVYAVELAQHSELSQKLATDSGQVIELSQSVKDLAHDLALRLKE